MAASRSDVLDDGLVEREFYLERLDLGVAQAAMGEGSLIYVEGMAGIGKSSLLKACRGRAAAAGARVLRARASELERDFAHGVARQLFEPVVLAAPSAERERLLAGPAANAAPVIFAPDTPRRHVAPVDSDFAAVHGLLWLAVHLAADGPLMLAVDDAHWADAASLRFLNHLAIRLEGLPMLVVIASRIGEPGAELTLLNGLAETAAATLRLPGLSFVGSSAVVARRLGGAPSEAFAAACHTASGGNPFLLLELLAELAADGVAGDDAAASLVRELGPRSVSRALLMRLSRLPSGAVEFARAVAVLGNNVELRDAAALAAIPLTLAADLADRLADLGVLATARPLCFVHPVILEAVAADLGPGERTAMHTRAATILYERDASAEQIASHLAATEAVGQPWAVSVLRDVARLALDRGAAEVATRYLRRALEEPVDRQTRGMVLAELGEASWLASEEAGVVVGYLREALALTEDPATRVRSTLTLARATFGSADVIGAARSLEHALEGADDLGAEGRMRIEAELGSIGLLNLTLMPSVRDRVAGFANIAGDTPAEMLQLCNLASLAWLEGTAEQAASVARRALRGGRLLAAETPDSVAYLQAAWVLAHADAVDEARAACDAALAEARERGSALGFVMACAIAAMAAWTAGDVRECEAHTRAALELTIPPFAHPMIYTYLGFALIERGALEEAEQALVDGWVGPYLPELIHMNMGFYARGLLRVAQGRDEEGVEDLCEFSVRQAHCRATNPAIPWRLTLAQAYLRLGREQDARELIQQHEALAQRWGTSSAIGIALCAQSEIAEAGDRVGLLEQAVAVLARSPARLDHARSLAALGGALRRAGRRAEAQRRSLEAIELAVACGATRLAERANEELVTAGARPRRLQFSGVDALTASERRVAKMAADGLSNAKIAQALFVTPKTVENHLGRVYIKLGIGSRRQLPSILDLNSLPAAPGPT